jgi:hypothetical protein
MRLFLTAYGAYVAQGKAAAYRRLRGRQFAGPSVPLTNIPAHLILTTSPRGPDRCPDAPAFMSSRHRRCPYVISNMLPPENAQPPQSMPTRRYGHGTCPSTIRLDSRGPSECATPLRDLRFPARTTISPIRQCQHGPPRSLPWLTPCHMPAPDSVPAAATLLTCCLTPLAADSCFESSSADIKGSLSFQ